MSKLDLYLLRRHDDGGYDTFSAAVVAAAGEAEARETHPRDWYTWNGALRAWVDDNGEDAEDTSWVPADEVLVTYLGVAAAGVKPGVICASFHAG